MTAVRERHDGLVWLEVDGVPCVAYPRLTGPVGLDDEVVVNIQARALGLGSGGFDVLYVNLTRGLELPHEAGAHVMTLPYTPLQNAVLHAEEQGQLASGLSGMPVVCASLHSQVAPIAAGLGGDARVAYVQVAGGALQVSLSDTLRALREAGLVATTVAAGPCFDAEVQCVNVYSALAWAATEAFDAVIVSIGPGIVGTSSALGHGGVAAAVAANAAAALGGSPVIAVRVSGGDPRERHRGVSHHSRAAVELCLGSVVAAWPEGFAAPDWLEPREEVDVTGWEEACAGLPLDHMGRGADDDPAFFAAAFAAGRVARRRLEDA